MTETNNNTLKNKSSDYQPEEYLEEDCQDPNKKALEDLARVVENTRLCRINASARLLSRERFIQNINIYYSCFSALITVLSLIYPKKSFGIASALLTVILAISIVYLNAQKFGTRAQQLQSNYNELQLLRYDIIRAIDNEQLNNRESFEKCYIELLETSENHTQHDYRHTLYYQDQKKRRKADHYLEYLFGNNLSGVQAFIFWSEEISSYLFKLTLWLIPISYLALAILGII